MNDNLRASFAALVERIDGFSLRERALIFVSILVVLYFAAANLVFAPLSAEQDQLRRKLTSARDQIQLQERQIQIIVGADNGESPYQTRMKALREQLRATDEALARATTGLVSPKEMARLVEQMLVKNRRLVVTKVESLPPAPLFGNSATSTSTSTIAPVPVATNAAGATASVYKHGMRIELSGRYLDIVEYLKSLEALPWKIFWAELTLQTDTYPTSRLTLLIHTLSFQEGWIAI